MRYQVLAAGIAVISCLLPLRAIAASFRQIYVFGDSLSDPGNLSSSTLSLIPQSPPYARRFSNGAVWTEYLAQDLGLDPTPVTQLPFRLLNPSQSGINFAFGGASTGRSSTVIEIEPFSQVGVLSQVDLFTDLVNLGFRPSSEEALYILLAGANDYAGNSNTNPVTDINGPINNLKTAIAQLTQVGARNILVGNLPDIGKTPRFQGNQRATELNQLITAHNQALSTLIKTLEQQFTTVNFLEFDLNRLFDEAIANPTDYGLTNTTDSCLNGFTFPFDFNYSTCSNPDEFLFWDDFHPTTTGHRLIASRAIAYLEEFQLTAPPVLNPLENAAAQPIPGSTFASKTSLALPQTTRTQLPASHSTSIPEPQVVLGLLSLSILGLKLWNKRSSASQSDSL